MAIISPGGSNNCLLSRLRALIKQQRLVHALSEGGLQAQFHTKMVPDSVPDKGCIDMSKWKKLDSRNLGIKPSMVSQPSWIVLKILQSEGFEAYLVGGCVRDLILKRIPKDFDVITTANLKQIKRQFYRAEIVGRRFPICRVHVKGSVIEVSSFETVAKHAGKKEADSPCRPPGCDKKDFIRWRNSMHRDFTINSLFFDPFANKIYDYANGMVDLRSLKLRTLGPAKLSFEEDCARILRGLRIAARLSLSISKETETAMHRLSSSILKLDKSRIMMELNYMLSYGAAEPSFCLLWRFDLLKILLPLHAAYFDRQSKNMKTAQSSTMLMKLFSSLDKVVSCDRPSESTLWVGLLAFHLALVNNPQDALVVLTFASVLYHEEWEEGVKFSRDNAEGIVNYVPEILCSSEFKSDKVLAKEVSQLASFVLDSISALTATESLIESMSRYPVFPCSGLVFVPKKMAEEVAEIFKGLVNIKSYNKGRKSLQIDYHSLGKGYLSEVRFVIGKVILETMNSGILQGKELVQELDYHLLQENVKNYNKGRKHSLIPDTPEVKQEMSKKLKLKEQKCHLFEQDTAINKQEVVELCQAPQRELIAVLGNMLEKRKFQLPEEEGIKKNQELSEDEKFQNKGEKKMHLKTIEKLQECMPPDMATKQQLNKVKKHNSSQEDTIKLKNMFQKKTQKVISEEIVEDRQVTDKGKGSLPPLPSVVSSEEIQKRKQVADNKKGGLPRLSSLFKR
ncbi:PREDICTED: poly(A) polymerase [Prunus dulcis]|uniref:PREDICTED: poly(A) polymerase n=1 Tax=Prunus dulcis TaxID=3755 RepID=A0A5E4E885_PRUDU|nr:uncharacterized protein LOC117636011 [Prunus dulcis]VVA10028.1 PREDICTED: poly(A) polymerase [Prunus dulcis]